MDSTALTAKLYFAAALRVGADASRTRLLPLSLLRQPLSPHERFSQRILLALQALGVIEPELTHSHAHDWLTGRDWIEHGFTSVSWRIVEPAGRFSDPASLARGFDATVGLSEDAVTALLELWEDLALAEVASYARWSLCGAGFNPAWAEDAASAMRQALVDFSAAQLMYLVFISIKSLALKHLQGTVPSSRLGLVFAATFSDYARRGSAERWQIKGMNRPRDLPESALAALFAHQLTPAGRRLSRQRPQSPSPCGCVACCPNHPLA